MGCFQAEVVGGMEVEEVVALAISITAAASYRSGSSPQQEVGEVEQETELGH
jgi:hypothetical protein